MPRSMKSYKAEELSADATYKILSGTVIPRPIAWLTTQNADGLVNVAPFSFFNIVSKNPALLSVSFTADKDSLNNIFTTKEAVVHLVTADNVAEMNQTAARLSADESEAEKFAIPLVPSKSVTVPSIKNSQVRFETKLYKHTPLENGGHLVLLKVVNFLIDDALIDEANFHIDMEAFKPIARLAGNQYAGLGEIFELKRPN